MCFGGARIVLMPITDSIHLVHGPLVVQHVHGILGEVNPQEKIYIKKDVLQTLQEKDIIFGGEKKLFETILELNKFTILEQYLCMQHVFLV